jgi:cytochrome P450
MSSKIDLPVPFGVSSTADPYRDYAALRADGGIKRITIRPGLEPWLVTRYDDIRAVLGSTQMSNDLANASAEVRQAIAAGCVEEKIGLFGKHLMNVDPPDHARMRRVMSRTFSARRVAALEEPVTVLTVQLLDALNGREEADLLIDYTLPLAVHVVCHLTGIPDCDYPLFYSWGQRMIRAGLNDTGTFEAVSDEMAGYLVPFIAAKRDRPGDDLTSILIAARDDKCLTDQELISLVYQPFFGGFESVAHFVSNAAFLLLNNPDQRVKLAANPGLLSSAIEEMLRFEGSVKMPTWRFATHPVVIGDILIAPGEPVLALLASGGRDEAKHRLPDQFMIDRDDTDHLAFGYGIHHCIGAALARMESRIAISRLFARFPEIQLARPAAALRWRVNIMMRGVRELPVRFNAIRDNP